MLIYSGKFLLSFIFFSLYLLVFMLEMYEKLGDILNRKANRRMSYIIK